jgi:hypothetical protein
MDEIPWACYRKLAIAKLLIMLELAEIAGCTGKLSKSAMAQCHILEAPGLPGSLDFCKWQTELREEVLEFLETDCGLFCEVALDNTEMVPIYQQYALSLLDGTGDLESVRDILDVESNHPNVYWNTSHQKWIGKFDHCGHTIVVGDFDDVETATTAVAQRRQELGIPPRTKGKGYGAAKRGSRWRGFAYYEGRRLLAGNFDTREEALKAGREKREQLLTNSD